MCPTSTSSEDVPETHDPAQPLSCAISINRGVFVTDLHQISSTPWKRTGGLPH